MKYEKIRDIIIIILLGAILVSVGYQDWFKPVYLIAQSSSSQIGTITINPGKVETLFNVTGKGIVRHIYLIVEGSAAPLARIYVIVDDKALWSFWRLLNSIRNETYTGHKFFRILQWDTVNNRYIVEITYEFKYTSSFMLQVGNEGTTAFTVIFFITYDKIVELRERI